MPRFVSGDLSINFTVEWSNSHQNRVKATVSVINLPPEDTQFGPVIIWTTSDLYVPVEYSDTRVAQEVLFWASYDTSDDTGDGIVSREAAFTATGDFEVRHAA